MSASFEPPSIIINRIGEDQDEENADDEDEERGEDDEARLEQDGEKWEEDEDESAGLFICFGERRPSTSSVRKKKMALLKCSVLSLARTASFFRDPSHFFFSLSSFLSSSRTHKV